MKSAGAKPWACYQVTDGPCLFQGPSTFFRRQSQKDQQDPEYEAFQPSYSQPLMKYQDLNPILGNSYWLVWGWPRILVFLRVLVWARAFVQLRRANGLYFLLKSTRVRILTPWWQSSPHPSREPLVRHFSAHCKNGNHNMSRAFSRD